MAALNELLGEELYLYVATSDDNDDPNFSETEVFQSQVELADFLNDIRVDQCEEGMVVIGGSAMKTMTLPPSLPMELETYLLVFENHLGTVIKVPESEDIDFVADLISNIIEQNPRIDIEDIYLVFGQEIDITLSIKGDDVDEEKIDAAKELVSEFLSDEEETLSSGV